MKMTSQNVNALKPKKSFIGQSFTISVVRRSGWSTGARTYSISAFVVFSYWKPTCLNRQLRGLHVSLHFLLRFPLRVIRNGSFMRQQTQLHSRRGSSFFSFLFLSASLVYTGVAHGRRAALVSNHPTLIGFWGGFRLNTLIYFRCTSSRIS